MNSHPRTQGFTLVETLVAITVLMIAIVGPYYSIQQAITASFAARDQLIASSMAQEAAEYIYYVRDSNYLAGKGQSDWLDTVDASDECGGAFGCAVDPKVATRIIQCTNRACDNVGPIKLNSNIGLYTYASGTATRFTRIAKVKRISATQSRVTVTVTWVTSHRDFSITVEENLYNWL